MCDTTIVEVRAINKWTFIALNRLLWAKILNRLKLTDKTTLGLYQTNYNESITRIMSCKKPLVPNTENMIKEGINDMKKNLMRWRNHRSSQGKEQIYAINKTEKPQAYQSKKDKSISNESNKSVSLNKPSSLDKSRTFQKTKTEDTVKALNIPRSIL